MTDLIKPICSTCSKEMVTYKPDNDLFGFYEEFPEFRCFYKCDSCKLIIEQTDDNEYSEYKENDND